MNTIFKVVDNETRVKLVLCISHGEKTVTQLIQNCGLSQSAVSQHLQKLRASGVLLDRKEGREVYYSVRDKKVLEICQKIVEYINQ